LGTIARIVGKERFFGPSGRHRHHHGGRHRRLRR
jgi:hypothetical protein